MTEFYLPVVGYEDYYMIGNMGNLISMRTLKKRKTFLDKDGYEKIKICVNGVIKYFFIHRIVANAFIDNPQNKPQVNHKNSIRNDNRVVNLEWVTPSENIRHGWIHGNIMPVFKGKFGSKCPSSKKVIQLSLGGKKIKEFECAAEAQRITGINAGHISSCRNGNRKTAGGYKWSF